MDNANAVRGEEFNTDGVTAEFIQKVSFRKILDDAHRMYVFLSGRDTGYRAHKGKAHSLREIRAERLNPYRRTNLVTEKEVFQSGFLQGWDAYAQENKDV